MIRSAPLAELRGVRHGFFGREGGVSEGLYASLNCGFGSGDVRDHVAINRARCAARLDAEPASLVTVYQVHGIEVATVDAPWAPEAAPRADALVTSHPGVALGILTADCAPVLLADWGAGIVAAAHAGWKGAKAGILKAVVAVMVAQGASRARIVACIGPTIGPGSYEVGPEFRDAFLADDPAAARFFAAAPGQRPHFDLQGFAAAALEAEKIGQVDRIVSDTCAERDRFFSYRRSCQNGEPDYGRQLSAIVLA